MKSKYYLVEDDVDGKAIAQFEEAMKQPFVLEGALMPDTHAGYTLPIGAAIITEGVIVPSYIGYDIGCGMLAVKYNTTKDEIMPHREQIHAEILKEIPVGFSRRSTPLYKSYNTGVKLFDQIMGDGGSLQIGTLGGGNHFIEIGVGQDDHVWLVIHSGSRNVGHTVASHFMAKAAGSDRAKEGHYPLYLGTQDGDDYVNNMIECMNFALRNRLEMKMIIERILCSFLGYNPAHGLTINKLHNYAEFIGGNGDEFKMIHRKGATSAKKNEYGVIPGNLRDGSYIVKGTGNRESLWSCSHGAGRKHSRAKAKEMFSLDDFKDQMVGSDIVCNITSSNIDESPMAYKDINSVIDMQVQNGLITIVDIVNPIINVKA